ncbi:hypothetical protein BGX34_011258 [Mortierella sp. NVP85]|nr:hypothetical protein BGX34_011258 [Mortierella sp. NVP85]
MEIEIKIRLFTEEDTARLEQVLGGEPFASEDQDNVFFEGFYNELIANQLVFRIRLIEKLGKDPIAVVALKGNAVLIDGIARVEEEEEVIDVNTAKAIIENPKLIPEAATSHRLLNTIVERVRCNFGYKHLGRFKNVRHKYHWQGYVVEIDRTTYLHGTAYEVEIESLDPEKAKEQLTTLLQEHHIAYGNSKYNKYENMINGTLL